MLKHINGPGLLRFFHTISLKLLIVFLSMLIGWYHFFPSQIVDHAMQGAMSLLIRVEPTYAWYYIPAEKPYGALDRNLIREDDDGLNLITKIDGERRLKAEIVDMHGKKLHAWEIDWFKIWPDATHLMKNVAPKERPGTNIHGAVVMENGDLIFNFEYLGLVRLNRYGEVVWRLPYQTHHSVHRHDDGHLWVCGLKTHSGKDPRFPNRKPPFSEYTLLEVTPAGKIVGEWSVAELLVENGLTGLLHMGIPTTNVRVLGGDYLHLNDVEPFPGTMQEDFFRRGDILVSLRNINTVFVFNRYTRKMRFICSGWFVRQHDPDFMDGNRFSVLDNNSIGPEAFGHQSRIVIVSARERAAKVFFEGDESAPFYTDIMGKHQWLPTGNLLITEAKKGRAFEITPDGRVVWEYVNHVDKDVVGLVDEVQRLPLKFKSIFYEG